MPIDYDILKKFGTTNERLREILTTDPSKDQDRTPSNDETELQRVERARKRRYDLEMKDKIKGIIMSRSWEAIVKSMKNWKKYAAVDMAHDTSVITGTTLPLLMYAQGRINIERAAQLLEQVPGGSSCVKKSPEGKPVSVDVPKFVEMSFNLVRSVINRRHSAQKVKFNQLYPYYKYESRTTGIVGKCRADVLSQRMEMMTDQFGYRHNDSQCMREAMLYGHTVDFMASSWEIEKQYRKKDLNGGAEGDNIEPVIVKEGVNWFHPHPSRLYWDNAYALSSINSDSGCSWLGFWDVVRFSEIDDNPYYFNKQGVGYGGRIWGQNGLYNAYADYFSYYGYSILPPNQGEPDLAKMNDRKALVGYYGTNQRDAPVFTNNFFWKIVPRDFGIGEYPYPVWIRFVTASDTTIMFAEIMPSTPAAVLSINELDSREVNLSLAMEILPYQDTLTNLLTHLLQVIRLDLFKAIGLNSDLLTSEQIKSMRAWFEGDQWYQRPTILEFSFAKLTDLGVAMTGSRENQGPFQIADMKQTQTINTAFEAIVKFISLSEKLINMSPAEQGQPAPREISATEVNEIANTTSSVYSGISDDIDEFRGSKKRILYESYTAKGEGKIRCPVMNRYTEETIKKAGFEPDPNENEDFIGSNKVQRRTVIGTTKALVHDYIFTSRDGSERPVNTQAANTLVQLANVVMSSQPIMQAMGKEKLYEMFNEIFRMSGAGFDLNLREGEDDSFGANDIQQMSQTLQQVQQYLQKMAAQLQNTEQTVEQLSQKEQEDEQQLKHLNDLAEKVRDIAQQHSDFENDLNDHKEKISEEIQKLLDYAKSPPSIRRQIEVRSGFRQATAQENEAETRNFIANGGKPEGNGKPKTNTTK